MIESLREGRVLRVTLNRPEQRNLMTAELAREIASIIEAAQADDAIGAVLLAAHGEFFCYGGEFAAFGPLTKPLVAAVRGAALGAGMALVASAHIAVASQGTSFGLLDIRNRAYPPGLDAVAAAIGWRRATELALTGRVCSTPEALQMGLVQEVAPVFEYEERAEAIARLVAEADAAVVRQILLKRHSSM